VLLNRLDGELTERQETYIRSVHNSGAHLLQLINGILDFSRIEAGKLEMLSEEVDLHELVDECIESSMPLGRGKQLKIEKNVPLELPPLSADRTKVKQILLNLLSNAIKFTAQGRVLVSVVAEPDAVRLSVADTALESARTIWRDCSSRSSSSTIRSRAAPGARASGWRSARSSSSSTAAASGRRAVRTKARRSISLCH
jgi:light-regulated signal transduction histidine kinase (bacteriophytochrome)